MKPRITLITIGVDDLERAVRFYRDGLGLPTPGIVGQQFEHDAVAFFDLAHGRGWRCGRAPAWRTTAGCRSARAAPPSSASRTTSRRVPKSTR
jgi:catechol 2,3-dioxygenase-like lactoylglutathione lyase family enzyme